MLLNFPLQLVDVHKCQLRMLHRIDGRNYSNDVVPTDLAHPTNNILQARWSSVVARNSPGRGVWAYHGFLARILEKISRGVFLIQVWLLGQDLCTNNAHDLALNSLSH